MKKGWKKVKITDYYTISSGLSKSADQFGSGSPFVSFKDVFWNYFLPQELTQLVNTSEIEQQKCSVKKGDVFLTRTSEKVEELAMSSVALRDYPNATFNGFTKRLRPLGDEIDPVFIGFYLRSIQFRAEVTAYSSLTTRASLNNDIIGRLQVHLPPLPTQKKIASILSAYDDLIENNLRRIKLLEEMAQQTYEEWFVRMKFPGHETAEWDEETGLPVGWERKKLGEVCELKMGQSPKSVYYNSEGEGLPFHQGVKDFGNRFPENCTWSTEGSRIANSGDILFSVRAPVGRLNLSICKMILGRGLCSIRYEFQSFMHNQLRVIFHSKDLMGGGAIYNSVTKKDMENIILLIPKESMIRQFDDVFKKTDTVIHDLHSQNQQLKEARDLLLPRLMMGLIDVEEVDNEELIMKNHDVAAGSGEASVAAEAESKYVKGKSKRV